MYAIASVPGREGRWTTEEFLASGETVIVGILGMLQARGVTPQGSRTLDVGCGLGRLTRALSYRFPEVWGVDISSTMIELAVSINADHDGCTFIVNDGRDLRDVPRNSFDLVLSLLTLQHVSEKPVIRSYIREFVRVSRPGGVIDVAERSGRNRLRALA
jgi:ubiquinone/menaquinone biosynthesis C-methylase UbiE